MFMSWKEKRLRTDKGGYGANFFNMGRNLARNRQTGITG